MPYNDFAKHGRGVGPRRRDHPKTIATLPVADDVPNGGVLPGPRGFRWHPLEPATLAWVEALDGGNPKTQVPHRDRIEHAGGAVQGRAGGAARRTEYRFSGLAWTDAGRGARDSEFDRDAALDPHLGGRRAPAPPRASCGIAAPRIATAIRARRCAAARASGTESIVQSGDTIFLAGAGASPQGDKPFLDTLSLTHAASRRASTR